MAIRPPSDIQSVAIERCPHLAEPLCAQLAPVRELVVWFCQNSGLGRKLVSF